MHESEAIVVMVHISMVSVPLRKTGKSHMLRCQRNTTQHPPTSNLEISHLFPFALLCVLHSIWQLKRQDLQACCQCIASHWLVQKRKRVCQNFETPSLRQTHVRRCPVLQVATCTHFTPLHVAIFQRGCCSCIARQAPCTKRGRFVARL